MITFGPLLDSLDPKKTFDLFVAPLTYYSIFKDTTFGWQTLRLGDYPIEMKVSKFVPENCIIVLDVNKGYLFRWTGKEMELVKEEYTMYQRKVLN